MTRRELATRVTEAIVGSIALVTLLVALLRDLVALLRGRLIPRKEGALYWRILYLWLLAGLPLGAHRRAASKTSWKIFPILSVYGVGLLCLAEIAFKNNEGDPSVDPTRFATGTKIATDIIAGSMLLIVLALWLLDMPLVVRGRLPNKQESDYFWHAFLGWLLPTGFLFGRHFCHFGRPLDWQLYTAMTTIGVLTGLTARQFAAIGHDQTTYLLTLSAGAGCFAINLLRWLNECGDMRFGSLLQRQLGVVRFERIRLQYYLTGLAYSGHQWALGRRVATFQTLLLHALGIWLLILAQGTVYGKGPAGAREANDSLRVISIGCLLLVLFLWLRDAVLLLAGKVDLRGERVEVVEDEMGEIIVSDGSQLGAGGGAAKQAEGGSADGGAGGGSADVDADGDDAVDVVIKPRAAWRCFRTHLGTNYYYDPATEMVHYLAANGKGNYAVDPIYNCTVVYDSLEQLDEQLEIRGRKGYGEPAGTSTSSAAAPGSDSDSAKAATAKSTMSTTRHARRNIPDEAVVVGGILSAVDQEV
jgi:hypothetical protein